jgi:hypothetical protein
MTSKANIIRRAFALLGATAVAGLAAPAALADPQGHRADLAERLVVSERAATAGRNTQTERFVGRDQPDGYQPGLRTATPSGGTSTGDSFAWDDAGIGAVAGVAFALLAGGALISLRSRGRVAHS